MVNFVVLDVAEPLGLSDDIIDPYTGASTWIVPAGPPTAAWLARTTGRPVCGVAALTGTALDNEVHSQALSMVRDLPTSVCGVGLGSCAEYLVHLRLMSMARDMATCAELVSRSAGRVTWVTDRSQANGLRSLLESFGLTAVSFRMLPAPVRYVDRLTLGWLQSGRPLCRSALQSARTGRWRPRGLTIDDMAHRLLGEEEPALRCRPLRGNPGSLLAAQALRHLPALFRGWHSLAREVAAGLHSSSAKAHSAIASHLGVERDTSSTGSYIAAYVTPSILASLRASAAAATAMARKPHSSAVIVGNDVLPPSRAMVRSAGVQGSTSILYQHGVFAERLLHDRPLTDLFAVWGPAGRRWVESTGFPTDRIIEIGAPLHVAPAGRGASRAVPRPRTGDGSRRCTALYASQPHVGVRMEDELVASQRHLAAVRHACRYAGLRLIVRPHPLEDRPGWGRWLSSTDVRVAGTSKPIGEDMDEADIFISRTSTTVLDALAHGLPVILFDLQGTPRSSPYEDVDGVVRVASEEDLADTLLHRAWRSLDPGTLESVLHDFCGPRDGTAGRRLVRELTARGTLQ